MTKTKICDADVRTVLGDSYPKFAMHRGQMASGDPLDPRFGTGRNGLCDLVQMFDTAASDGRASAAERAECARARDLVQGALDALELAAR